MNKLRPVTLPWSEMAINESAVALLSGVSLIAKCLQHGEARISISDRRLQNKSLPVNDTGKRADKPPVYSHVTWRRPSRPGRRATMDRPERRSTVHYGLPRAVYRQTSGSSRPMRTLFRALGVSARRLIRTFGVTRDYFVSVDQSSVLSESSVVKTALYVRHGFHGLSRMESIQRGGGLRTGISSSIQSIFIQCKSM